MNEVLLQTDGCCFFEMARSGGLVAALTSDLVGN